MKNWKRNLLVGVIWGLFFFVWWLNGFYQNNWRFNVFSLESWSHIYHEFMGGWVISAASDWIFLWVLILAIPVFMIGWNICVKIRWRKTIGGFFKNIWYFLKRLWYKARGTKPLIGKKKIKYVKKKSYKKVRPKPLHVTQKSMERAAKERSNYASIEAPAGPAPYAGGGNAAQNTFTPTMGGGLGASAGSVPSFLEDDDFSNISLDDIQLPAREPLNEDVAQILVQGHYVVIADAKIGETPVDFVAIDKERIFVLVSDNEKGDWLADEERFNNEDPLWFSESSHRVSPIFKMNTDIKSFAERLQGNGLSYQVIPVLVEKEGTLINAEDMQNTWKEMGIIVCRTHLGGPDELPSVAQSFPATQTPAEAGDIEQIRNAF